ncbi:hypothetical protein SARC_09817 [Sphaeroforma arctica JP610]|uniref:Uncharacterized protein n=1 Tax=Sphaeroforma arctica JP610 TaxID=667725 RepID=A0A0L0FP30_9EUKA|nr:hypothetical protein SARC_09817 [Sphaeroforma arctica JP610]KNC77733.1 hypothetical protein SARC_09817 [Sphaeroforma arctica JP610]|eukprot:XP_014151635.1 hypothetical protein SARC_09817 [Sphaeroforma arctica JP610]
MKLFNDGSLDLAGEQLTLHCGACSSMFLICTCHDHGQGVNFVFRGLPKSVPGSTPRQLLNRWMSLTRHLKILERFNAQQYLSDAGDTLTQTLHRSGHKLISMAEDLCKQDDMNLVLIKLVQSYQLPMSQNATDAVRKEIMAAARAFVSGDWACVTWLGSISLNNAFQVSDPEKYSLADKDLGVIFDGITVLLSTHEVQFRSPYKFLCMEPERSESDITRQFWATHTVPDGEAKLKV